MAGNPTPKRLVVQVENDRFVFYFEGEENVYWVVRDHPDREGWFLVEEYVHGWLAGEFYDSYENAGVSSLWKLAQKLKEDPETTLEGLFGERIPISEVVVG